MRTRHAADAAAADAHLVDGHLVVVDLAGAAPHAAVAGFRGRDHTVAVRVRGVLTGVHHETAVFAIPEGVADR